MKPKSKSKKSVPSYDYKPDLSSLASNINEILLQSLSMSFPTGVTKAQKVAILTAQYSEAKHSIQEAVAAAFSNAMSLYSGQDVDFICQVLPVPEPESKLVN